MTLKHNKDEMTLEQFIRKLVFNSKITDNNGDHNVLSEQFAHCWEEYYATSRPDRQSICAVLGLRSLDPKFATHRCGLDPNYLEMDILSRGAGALDYIERNLIRQTNIDPQFAVLSLASLCTDNSLRKFRTPTPNKHDIVFSKTPLDDRFTFDNDLYIPSPNGYYGFLKPQGKSNE